MKILKKISDWIDTVCGALTVVLVAAMVLVTTAQIVCRILSGPISFIKPLNWSEEVTRFMLVWASFIGAVCAYTHGSNIAITAVQNLMPENTRKYFRALVHLVCIALFIALVVFGNRYCAKQVRNAAAVKVQMKYIYMVIPQSMVLLTFQAFTLMLEELFGKKEAE